MVDDASKEPFTYSKNPKVKIIRHKKNLGVSSARNTGIKASSSEWLAFLDSDDEWLSNKIEHQLKDLKNKPDIKFFYTDEQWIRNNKPVHKKTHQLKKSGWVFRDCLKQCFIGASTTLINKSVFNDVGFFDPKLKVCEDYDFWIRASHKYQIFLNPKELIKKHGGHDDQLSTKYFAMDYYRLLSLVNFRKNTQASSFLDDLIHEKNRILTKGALKHQNTALLAELEKLGLTSNG